jgi:hypothetical protein
MEEGLPMTVVTNLTIDFFVAMGMVIGGALLGAFGAVFMHVPPMTTMVRLADQLKIWAMVSTLGGTMDTLRVIETGVFSRQPLAVGKQFSYLVAAFLGCQAGYLLVRWFAGSEHPL